MRLLIVNDEVLTAETIKEEIPWENYGISQVLTAYDVESGKEWICKNDIDILLCDIEMPGKNGLELLRWIRENEMEIECIFLTCHASFEYAKEAINLGCREYILIPARYEEIGRAVQKVGNRILQERQAKQYQEYGKMAVKEKTWQVEKDHVQKKTSGELTEEIMRYIYRNLSSPTLSVNEVAENFSFHPVYLNRIFKKEKGISIGQYMIAERMKFAGKLLKTKHLNANYVAEQVGYENYVNFNLMFRKYYGCSPSQYVEVDYGSKKEV